ncbi:MAG: DUF362 domain-containing protein [Deltaproteobacteria bacterium]|nr:DUF362 domain-containing protein [Deltaproteobacteria bacterium]
MTAKPSTSNPFCRNGTPAAFVAGGNGPYANTCSVLSGLDLTPVRGKQVLLKPNAGRPAACNEGINTHPQVIAAAIDTLKKAGAEVAVGESPITGVSTMEAFETTGIAAVAQERDCRLIDMDERPCVRIPLATGRAITELQICADIFDFDYIISVPVMKTHMHTGVTLSVKNMKGCLWRRSKVELHMRPEVPGINEKPLHIAIADMSAVLRPHIALIDGTVGMEGMGPSAGSARTLDVVIAATDAFAADAIACRLMGMQAKDVPYLRMGAERGYGSIDLDSVEITPDNWQKWCVTFDPPPANIKVAYPDMDILDQNSCSACQSTLMLFLKKYGKAVIDYFPAGSRISLAIGKGHKSVPDQTVCIGNCMARHRQGHTFIPGCPPVGSEILKAITGETSLASGKVSKDIKE